MSNNIVELSEDPRFKSLIKNNGKKLVKSISILFIINILAGLLIMSFALRHFDKETIFASIEIGILLLVFLLINLGFVLIVITIIALSIFIGIKQISDLENV